MYNQNYPKEMASIVSKPEMQWQGGYNTFQNNNGLLNNIAQSQCSLGNQIQGLTQGVNEVLNDVRKNHKKQKEFVLCLRGESIVGVQYYDNGSSQILPITLENYGRIVIIKLEVMDKYEFLIIKWGKNVLPVILMESEITASSLYRAFLESGIRFGTIVQESKIKKALYEYIMAEKNNCSSRIKKSGYAGWENGKFYYAERELLYELYKNKLKLPVFSKHFNMTAINTLKVKDYEKCLGAIKNLENRVWFSIIPFCALMLSPLQDLHIYQPFVVNLVMMTEKIKLQDLTSYLQIFNRTCIDVHDISDSEKNIKCVIQSAKDETILFMGIQDNLLSYYKNQKIISNFSRITKNALGKGSVTFGEERGIQGIIIGISGHIIMQKEVQHIFIDDDFFDKIGNYFIDDVWESVWGAFIQYEEKRYKEIVSLLQDIEADSLKEKYWKLIIALIDVFWKSVGTSLVEVLNLPRDFSFEFLWKEEECDLEDILEIIIKMLRKEITKFSAISKEKMQGGESLVYDDTYLWVTPELFSEMMKSSAIAISKQQMLIKCKEEGLLLPSNVGGYTLRLQKGNTRKEYYRFVRDRFNEVGKTEIIDLIGEK